MTESGCSTNLEEERLKSFLLQLHSESGVLNRLVYKNKNQHRRCPYFQALLKVQRDLRLLQSAGLEDNLSVLFAIIDGKQPAQKAYVSKQQKKKNHSRRHTYQERLLGVARLLSQVQLLFIKPYFDKWSLHDYILQLMFTKANVISHSASFVKGKEGSVGYRRYH